MEIVRTARSLRAQIRAWRSAGERIAFVPTMGNLHAGHLALVHHVRAGAGRVVASVFVNPMQFGPQEDLASYPVTLEADKAALNAEDENVGRNGSPTRVIEIFFPKRVHQAEMLTGTTGEKVDKLVDRLRESKVC